MSRKFRPPLTVSAIVSSYVQQHSSIRIVARIRFAADPRAKVRGRPRYRAIEKDITVEVIKINGSFNGIIESCPIPESGTRFRPENHLRNAVINTNPLPLYLSQHSLQQSRYVHPNVRLYNRTLPFLYIFEHYW